MSELLELTVAAAIERIASGEISSDEYFDAYHGAGGDELNAYLWKAEGHASGSADGELRGVPIAVKDIFCTEGVATTAGSKIL